MPFLEYIDISNNKLDGPIPHKFLESLRSICKPTIRLSENQLTGVVPQEFDRFMDMTLHLSGNQFLGLPVVLCDNLNWNHGHVGQYGCDAILCRPGTTNKLGRRTTDFDCVKCTSATYFGDTSCARQVSSAKSSRLRLFDHGAVSGLVLALALFLKRTWNRHKTTQRLGISLLYGVAHVITCRNIKYLTATTRHSTTKFLAWCLLHVWVHLPCCREKSAI